MTRPLTLGVAVKYARTSRTSLSARAASIAAGLSESYVGKVEAGSIEPSFRAFAKIARIVKITPAEVDLLLRLEADDRGE